MTTKPEPQAEYDFRSGVRGKHRQAISDPALARRERRKAQEGAVKKPGDRAPKTIKR
jgi:hypothetical protein